MSKTRTAIIGTGGIAKLHLQAMHALSDHIEIIGAVDIDAERVQAFSVEQGIPRWYTSAQDMLEQEQPDLVHICTPPATHFTLSQMALKAGAWVLCEKPLYGSLAQFDELEALQKRLNRYVGTVFQWRFGSGAQHIKKLIASGLVGRALVGLCQTLWYRPQAYYDMPGHGTWADEYGGISMTDGIHLMDLFLWLMGSDWEQVQAVMGTLDRDVEVEDVSMAIVSFANGALGNITNSIVSPRQESYMRLDMQKITLELHALHYAGNADWNFTLADGSSNQNILAACQAIKGDFTGDHVAVLNDMLAAKEYGTRPLVSGAEARRILEFLASFYKSALTGRPVQRGSITPDDPFYWSMNGETTHPPNL